MIGQEERVTQVLSKLEPYDLAQKRYRDLVARRQLIQKNMAKWPPGDVHIITNNNTAQFYIRTDKSDKSGKYLPKSESKTIQSYLRKKYEKRVLKLIDSEIKGLEECLKKKEIPDKIRNMYSDFDVKIQSFLDPIDMSDSDYARSWIAQPYLGKSLPPDIPVFVSDKGDHVRSKSELNIANTLYKLGIPYKYECPLTLKKGYTIYPDFTVLNVKTRKEIYWEHRGMMDDKDYSNHSVMRLKDYEKAGVFLGDRLIITEETSTVPLGTADIEMTIKHYFMS